MTVQVLLIGAGGHGKVVGDALASIGWSIETYVDAKPVGWLKADRIERDDDAIEHCREGAAVIGIGGVSPAALAARHALMTRYRDAGYTFPAVVDARAIISASARVSPGVQVLAGAIVNANASVADGGIVNTRAVVEHDVSIGEGSHIAPGAMVLGGATVGSFCMIGAGAVVMPGARVPDKTLVPALGLYPR